MTLAGPEAPIAAVGGGGAVRVNVAPECAWSASSEATWITDVTPAKGQGAGNVQFKAAANPLAASRQGDIAVSGTLVHVSQEPAPCVFDITPRAVTLGFAGGRGSATVTTAAGCAWTAVSEASWITVTSARDNNGPGTVTLDVAANPDAGTRTGRVTVAGTTVTVEQSASPLPSCSSVINPTSAGFSSAGGIGSVAVAAAAGCAWTATANAAWIVVTSGASGSGPGTVTYDVGTNPGAARSASLVIGGQSFIVNQASLSCPFTIGPTSQNVSNTSGTGATVAVTAPASCSWTAMSNDSWITVTPPSTQVGSGSVGWTYTANPVPAKRTGTMTIAGHTFTVTQDAACSYAISPTSQSVSSVAGTGATVQVTTQTACAWTAVSNASWIAVNPLGSTTGSGSVGWTYSANVGPQRSGTMTIAGRTFKVDQAAPCSFVNVAPLGQTVSAQGGPGTPLTVTISTGCSWAAVSNDAWITVTSGASGNGTGTVRFSVAANVVYAARAGTLTIAGQVVTVIQNGVVP